MHPVRPDTGAHEFVAAENQPEYSPYPAAIYRTADGRLTILSRWSFSKEEREAIARGEDVYLGLITDGNPIQPLMIQVGPQGVESEEDFARELGSVDWIQPGAGSFICPKCHTEFDKLEDCVAHVQAHENDAMLPGPRLS